MVLATSCAPSAVCAHGDGQDRSAYLQEGQSVTYDVEWDHCNKLLDKLPLLKDESSMEPVPGYKTTKQINDVSEILSTENLRQ